MHLVIYAIVYGKAVRRWPGPIVDTDFGNIEPRPGEVALLGSKEEKGSNIRAAPIRTGTLSAVISIIHGK